MICILQDVTKTISLLVYSFKLFQTKYAPALAVAAFLATETNTKYLVYNVQREQGTRPDSTTSTVYPPYTQVGSKTKLRVWCVDREKHGTHYGPPCR